MLAVDDNYAIWQARFSPDRRWISFAAVDAREPGIDTIFVIPSAGADRSHWTTLSSGHGWADKPRWSPDGKLVYFTQADSFLNVWAVRFERRRGNGYRRAFPGHPLRQPATPAVAQVWRGGNRRVGAAADPHHHGAERHIWTMDDIDK